MATVGVDFFRVDRARAVRRLLMVAATLVTVGATTIGAHLVQRLHSSGHVISLVGGAITLSGLVLGFGSLAMLLFENVYILFTEEALVLHENGKETKIAWDDLSSVKVGDEKGFLVIERGAGPLSWFVGAPAAEIAGKITEARRKALLGLLRN